MEAKSLFAANEYPAAGGSNQLLQALPGTGRFRLTERGQKTFVSRTSGLFADTAPELRRLKKKHPKLKFNFDNNNSLKFQLVTLLILHSRIAFTRQDLQAFVDRIGLHSGDVIQSVNKTPQWGLKRWKQTVGGQTFYSLPTPLQFDNSKLQLRTGATPQSGQKDSQIKAAKERIKKLFIEVDERDWDWGHKDPVKGARGGFVVQPASYNRAHKDHYKFDQDGLKECPTVGYLLNNLDRFYTPEEQLALAAGLRKRLEDKSGR